MCMVELGGLELARMSRKKLHHHGASQKEQCTADFITMHVALAIPLLKLMADVQCYVKTMSGLQRVSVVCNQK